MCTELLNAGHFGKKVRKTSSYERLSASQRQGLLKYPDCQLQNTVKLAEAEKCIIIYLIELSF